MNASSLQFSQAELLVSLTIFESHVVDQDIEDESHFTQRFRALQTVN